MIVGNLEKSWLKMETFEMTNQCIMSPGDNHLLVIHFSLTTPAEVSVCGYQIWAAHCVRVAEIRLEIDGIGQ